MSLLSTVQRAAILVGQTVPVTMANATGITRELVELARLDAEELATRQEWQALLKDHTFTTVAAELQPDGLPSDFGRMSERGGFWDRTGHLQLYPLSSEGWAETRALAINGVFNRFRIAGGQFYVVPAPSAGQTVGYPYITSNLYSSGAAWTADADTCLLPEPLISLGVVWRWKAMKGLSYAEEMQTYERAFERAATADGSGPDVIHLSRPRFGDVEMAYPGVIIP